MSLGLRNRNRKQKPKRKRNGPRTKVVPGRRSRRTIVIRGWQFETTFRWRSKGQTARAEPPRQESTTAVELLTLAETHRDPALNACTPGVGARHFDAIVAKSLGSSVIFMLGTDAIGGGASPVAAVAPGTMDLGTVLHTSIQASIQGSFRASTVCFIARSLAPFSGRVCGAQDRDRVDFDKTIALPG